MARILAINLGSTSTKTAVFEDAREVAAQTLYHDPQLLAKMTDVDQQYPLRRDALWDWLRETGYAEAAFDAVVARGGFTRPIPGGVWLINEPMLADLASGKYGVHVTNLTARLAHELAKWRGIPCYVVDPAVIDERNDVARISGCAAIERRCIIHALNHKATAREAAKLLNKRYGECAFIVAHLGGGISVGLHEGGRIVDANDGLSGEGPFSPERSGGLPGLALIDLCFSGEYDRDQLRRLVTGAGGMISYTGTSDMRELERRAADEPRIALLIEAMCYQVSKEILSYAAALRGAPDAIVLTGGLARSGLIVELIKSRAGWFAPVMVFPGEDENRALAMGALRALSGEEPPRIYEQAPV